MTRVPITAGARVVLSRPAQICDFPDSIAESETWSTAQWILALARKDDVYWIPDRRRYDVCMP